jgi:tyrosyl-tRNA synthetase
MPNVIDLLQERGFIDAMTSEELRDRAEEPLRVYSGFDPTSDSLHIGSMVPIMALAWFQRCGHTPVVLVGGATGMIGDPSGRNQERQLQNEESIQRNLAGIRKNLEVILETPYNELKPIFVNNYDWFKKFSFIDFLRDVGKHFRIGPMLAKESVRSRMESEEGMSFTEFSYQLLQGYDFYYLQKNHGVSLQIGGCDQWGNITAGTDFIRKMGGGVADGLTLPLLMSSDGQKFGKSEKGAIWLSPEKLSPYEFYQYLVRVPDADVIMLMRLLTFIPMSEIRDIQASMGYNNYQANSAQRRLAEEVTRIVHGEKGLETALKVTSAAAPGSAAELNAAVLEALEGDMPSRTLAESELINISLIDLLVNVGLQSSKGEARKLLRNGGVYLNNRKIEQENRVVEATDLIEERLMLLSVGKKNKILIRLQ